MAHSLGFKFEGPNPLEKQQIFHPKILELPEDRPHLGPVIPASNGLSDLVHSKLQ